MPPHAASMLSKIPMALAFVAWIFLAWIVLAGGAPSAGCGDRIYRDPVTGRQAAFPPARVTTDGLVSCR